MCDPGHNAQVHSWRTIAMTSLTASNDSFPRFLGRFQVRDGEAGRELFRRFTGQLVALARRRFTPPFRGRVDPEDVVQSVYKSFFRRYADGGLTVDNWNGLWGLRTLITLRKCAERVAYHRAECRDITREASAPPVHEAAAPWLEAPGREPGPHEAAELAELVGRLLDGLS